MVTRLLRHGGLGLAAVCALGLFGGAAPARGETHAASTLTVVVDGPGEVLSTPSGISCDAPSCDASFPVNQAITLTPIAHSGAQFVNWAGDCSGSGPCAVLLDESKNVTAVFATLSPAPPPPPPPPPVTTVAGGQPPPLSPPPNPVSPQPAPRRTNEVEQAVEGLQRASIVYNAPTTLHLGETAEIQLLLSPRQTVAQLKEKLTGIGARQGRTVRFSNQMTAYLTGPHFTIELINGSAEKAVNPATTTAWRWDVEPTRTGQQSLHLSLYAQILVDGRETPYEVKTFDTELRVNVTWFDRLGDFASGNWQWLWTAILFPIGAWLVANRKRWLWRFRSGPPARSS
jgi:hypothetical protein